jgi:hypothetical protein
MKVGRKWRQYIEEGKGKAEGTKETWRKVIAKTREIKRKKLLTHFIPI